MDKVKIKLSELTEMYDIEQDEINADDTANTPIDAKELEPILLKSQEKKQQEYDQYQDTIEEADEKLEEEFFN